MKLLITILILSYGLGLSAQPKKERFEANGNVQVEWLTKLPGTKAAMRNKDSVFKANRFVTLELLDTVPGIVKTINSAGAEITRGAGYGIMAYIRVELDTVIGNHRDTILIKRDTVLRRIYLAKAGGNLTGTNVFIHN